MWDSKIHIFHLSSTKIFKRFIFLFHLSIQEEIKIGEEEEEEEISLIELPKIITNKNHRKILKSKCSETLLL